MQQLQQSPWWWAIPVMGLAGVIIAAAIGGIAGVYGHHLAQKRTDRREEARWQRERRERREQWEREDMARREQFEREDRARWHSERHAQFSAAVTAVEGWVAQAATPGLINPAGLTAEAPAVQGALSAMFIVASPQAVETMRGVSRAISLITFLAGQRERFDDVPVGIEEVDGNVTVIGPGFSADQVVSSGARLIGSLLVDLAREDLDVSDEPSKRTRSLQEVLQTMRAGWRAEGRDLTDGGRATVAMDMLLEILAPDRVTYPAPTPRRRAEPE